MVTATAESGFIAAIEALPGALCYDYSFQTKLESAQCRTIFLAKN